MQYRSLLSSLSRISGLRQSNHFGAIFALSLSLILTACGGGGNTVTDNNAADPGPDGIAPTLLSVSIKQSKTRNASADGTAKLGDSISVSFEASEALMQPEVTIGGFVADVTGKIGDWTAVREMTELDMDGVVSFTISYTDISGVEGVAGSATTDDSAVEYCTEGCVEPEPITLTGSWTLAGEGAAGVGPTAGSKEWFATNAANGAGIEGRPCLFDDAFVFGDDGSFSNQMGDATWVEGWQGADADGCGAPVAPHDGSIAATYAYDEAAGTLTLSGQGAHLGLAKVVNGSELASSSEAPESITYTVLTFDGDFLSVVVEAGDGVFWTFDLAKTQPSPLAGTWRLDGEGAAGVGPTAGSKEWFATNAANGAGIEARACLFDDGFVFGADGSFTNQMGDATWVEGWQGADADGCGAPVAPHDGSIAATFVYDEDAGTVTLNGQGAHLGLAKVVNGSELASSSAAPESITYTVLTFDGSYMSVVVEAGDGVFWTYDLVKDQPSPLAGTWRLDGEGAAGVGPTAGSKEWFATNAANGAGTEARACLFDDGFVFGADGSFTNQMGDATWVEGWQGADADGCGAPVAPHDGSIAATFVYDEAAGTVTLNGQGAHLGLAKVVNGSELASSSAAPESITYTVLTFDGSYMSVVVEAGDGVFWTYDLVKDQPSPLAGTWRLDGEGAAGVGPTAGSKEWFATNAANGAGTEARACLFDDGFVFGADGSFTNQMGDSTWVEGWQGADADGCGAPVAPHDGSIAATFVFDEDAGTVTLNGQGAHLGLAKVVNGSELASSSAAPESITYTVLTFDGDYMTVVVEAGDGVFWTYDLVKDGDTETPEVSILAGVWELDGEGAAGVGPTAGSKEWFATNAANGAGLEGRPCLFDDGFVFGADGSFTNQMGDATWVEGWQGADADGCGAPVAPHDGSIAATFSYDEDAGTITLTGQGAHLGLAKVVNGSELTSPSAAPESITYTILTIDSEYLSVVLEAGDGVFWTYDLVKQ